MNYVTHCINEDIATADRTAETTINLLYEYFSTSDLVTKFFDVSEVICDDSSSPVIYYIKLIPLAENLNDTYIKIYANTSRLSIDYKDTNNTLKILSNIPFTSAIYTNICSDENQIKISLGTMSSSVVTFSKSFMITPVKLNTGEVSSVLLFTFSDNNYLYAILNKSSIKTAISIETGSNVVDNSGYVLLRKYATITNAGDTISFDKVFTVFGASSLPTRFTVNNKEYFGFNGNNICTLFE